MFKFCRIGVAFSQELLYWTKQSYQTVFVVIAGHFEPPSGITDVNLILGGGEEKRNLNLSSLCWRGDFCHDSISENISEELLFKKSLTIRNIMASPTPFRVVFWDILPCKMIVDRRFRGAYCLHHQG
jgi:hypothetical protein